MQKPGFPDQENRWGAYLLTAFNDYNKGMTYALEKLKHNNIGNCFQCVQGDLKNIHDVFKYEQKTRSGSKKVFGIV